MFAGMGLAEVRGLRVLAEENKRFKQLVADPSWAKRCSGCAAKEALKTAKHLETGGLL